MEARGDWDIRGKDAETALAGEITGSIISTAWRVNAEFDNGFPNWGLYRAAIAGDSLYTSRLREWVVAFAVAHGESGGVRKDAYSDELACVAGWDALHIVIHMRELQPHTVTADALGVHHKTYRRFRDSLARRMLASLREYMVRMVVTFPEVLRDERKCGF